MTRPLIIIQKPFVLGQYKNKFICNQNLSIWKWNIFCTLSSYQVSSNLIWHVPRLTKPLLSSCLCYKSIWSLRWSRPPRRSKLTLTAFHRPILIFYDVRVLWYWNEILYLTSFGPFLNNHFRKDHSQEGYFTQEIFLLKTCLEINDRRKTEVRWIYLV